MSSSRSRRFTSLLSLSRVRKPVTQWLGGFTRRATSSRERGGPNLIDGLPAEILIDIFEKLCWRDLLSVWMVSRRFRDLSAPLRLKTFKLRYDTPVHRHDDSKCSSCRDRGWQDRDIGRLNRAYSKSNSGEPAEPLDPLTRHAIGLARKEPPDPSLVAAEELVVFFSKSWWQPWGPGFEDCLAGMGDCLPEVMASMPKLRVVRVHTVWWPDRGSPASEGIAHILRSVCGYCTSRGGIDVHVALDVRDAGEFIGCTRSNWDYSPSGLSSLSLTLPVYYSFTFLYGGSIVKRNPKLAGPKTVQEVPQVRHANRLRMGPWQDDWLWHHDGDVEGPLDTDDYLRRYGFA